MDKSTIITLVSNMGSPAFLADEDGKVLLKNISMRYIRERLGTGELHHLNEMKPIGFVNLKSEIRISTDWFTIWIILTEIRSGCLCLTDPFPQIRP